MSDEREEPEPIAPSYVQRQSYDSGSRGRGQDNWRDRGSSGSLDNRRGGDFRRGDDHRRGDRGDNQYRRGDGYSRRGDSNHSRDNTNDFRRDSGNKKSIDVPSHKVGRIIGKGGSKIRDLELESEAKIKIGESNGNTTDVTLTGTDAAISKVEELINDLVVDRPPPPQRNWE